MKDLTTYSFEEIRNALRKAYTAGDVDAAQYFADYLDSQFRDNQTRKDIPEIDFTTGDVIQEQPQAEPEPSFTDRALGVGEAALTLGTGATTGAAGAVAGGVSGIYDEVKSGEFGTREAADRIQNRFMAGAEGLTYNPKTDVGQDYVKNVDETLGPATAPFLGLSQLQSVGSSTRGGAFRRSGDDSKVSADLARARQSQRFLSKEGGNLPPAGTGQMGAMRNLIESIGEVGTLSRNISEKRNKVNADIISRSLQTLIDKAPENISKDTGGIGEFTFNIIQEGKKAASDIYGRNLDNIKQDYGNLRVKTNPVAKDLKNFLKNNKRETGSLLDATTIRVVNNAIDALEDKPKPQKGLRAFTGSKPERVPDTTRTVNDLIDYQKSFNSEIDNIGTFGAAGFNGRASRELAQVSNLVRKGLEREYSNTSPELANLYKSNNQQYTSTLNALTPKITANAIKNASEKSEFMPLGRLLVETKDPQKINSVMKSIDEAFANLKKSGEDISKLGVKSPEEVKTAVRSSYLNNIFGKASNDPDELFSKTLSNMYDDLGKANEAARIKAIMGDDYSTYKKFLGTIKDAAERPEGSFLGLSIRSREMTTGIAATTAMFSGGFAAGTPGIIGTAALVFGTPVVLSKIASRPKAIDKLLKLDRVDLTDPTLKPQVVTVMLNNVLSALGEEDEAMVRGMIEEQQKRLKQQEEN